jgi:serine/threonine protein kinase
MAKTYNTRWEVVEQLREGGQAHTDIVRDIQDPHGLKYALKRLKNLKRLPRFKREVETLLKLDHHDILKIVDHSFELPEPFLVSRYCEGGNLDDLVRKNLPSVNETFRMFIVIANAVNYAHSQHVVHRDLKPANIFLQVPTFRPLVGDFGLCYVQDESGDDRHTDLEEAVGPRFFMAPELEDGRADVIAPSADVYSLGKLLYWMLTGKIFSREKLRDDRWNLAKVIPHQFEPGDNSEMEHINRLLDHMIVDDPTRRANLSDVIHSANRIQQLISRGINPVTGKSPMNCTFCGWGKYQLIHNKSDVHNFGLTPVGNPDWRVLACNECGHIQLFRLDHARKDSWWVR